MSTCCQPNFTEILIRLQTVIPETINLTFSPGAFGYEENQPDEAMVIGMGTGDLYWFDPFNLTFIRSGSVWTALSIVLYNGSLFTSIGSIPTIYVLDSQTMTSITNITYPNLSETRKYMFLNDGKTMIATTQNNMSLSVFNVTSPTDYNFQVNDTTFFS
jgi:hypothetical protein